MKVKITPIGESAQLIEFNVSLPCGARASVAPVSTLTITQRWAKVINTATTGAASYMQVTKFDIIHNTQYTDCKGNVRLVTEETSTILASPATIRKSKEFIQSQIKAKEEKVNTLLELMESDPEMKKRFEELMMNKTAK